MNPNDTARPDPWAELRRLTPARIALGRAGTSLPTAAQLDFQAAHAQARDAVHLAFDHQALREGLTAQGRETLVLKSAAPDRHTYLQRPDLGRKLSEESAHELQAYAAEHPDGFDVAVVIADGLSALAVHRHALPFLERLTDQAKADGWRWAPVTLVEQGRVAVGDEIGGLLKARLLVMLIGERPGLSSPDSLGLYFTYGPRPGLNDAGRNCISNVRLEGLAYGLAAHKLLYLMREADRRKLSGVQLKEEAEVPLLEGGEENARVGNFLTAF